MYCIHCGNKVDSSMKFCSYCGFKIAKEQLNKNPSKDKNTTVEIIFGIGLLVMIVIIITFTVTNSKLYFTNNPYVNDYENIKNSNNGKTIIVNDNRYYNVLINGVDDANKLIEKDSVNQKDKCPKEILDVENEIIDRFSITAVNLCEMDVEFARNLENVIDYIYEEYPEVRGHLTNLTLTNYSGSEKGIIAAYAPAFIFATSNLEQSFPWVIKTQIFLNSRFFLNKKLLQSSTEAGSLAGHFPANSNIYSPMAHEFGHFISYISMMKYYDVDSTLLIYKNDKEILNTLIDDFNVGDYSKKLLKEAYNKYLKDNNTNMSFNEWRGSISGYALDKDNNGKYIYDETIAEAFHDVYLNGENAKLASKYIVKTLKESLK